MEEMLTEEMRHYLDYKGKDFALDENFQKFVLSADEATTAFWNEFMEKYPHKQKDMGKGVELIRLSGLTLDQEANNAFLKVWGNVHANTRKKTISSPQRYVAWSAAAAVLLLAVAYLLWFRTTAGIEYKTNYAEIKKIKLQDGSEVTLNANSLLRVPQDMTGSDGRKVFLQGEAFFKVEKTPDHQTFEVTTSEDLKVQVLGTEFSVNTRRENLSVYLQSGKVKLFSSTGDHILSPGDQAYYNIESKKIQVTRIKPQVATDQIAWMGGQYVMNDLPLSEIARDIEDNFGVSVTALAPSLAAKRVTAKVPSQNLEILLKVLSEALDLKIETKNHQIIMKARQ